MTTILYYTSNQEPETFEQRIREHLYVTSNCACPIVSVSHALLNFGTNICVGRQHVGEQSRLQQIWIGLHYCTTPYVVMAEADFLYPPEYFTFVPPDPTAIYRYAPIYLLYMWKEGWGNGQFWHKNYSEGARLGTRQAQFDRIETVMRFYNPDIEPREWPIIQQWLRDTPQHPPLLTRSPDLPPPTQQTAMHDMVLVEGLPAVSMRTTFGMNNPRKACPAGHGVDTLPFWGDSTQLRIQFGRGVPEFARFVI